MYDYFKHIRKLHETIPPRLYVGDIPLLLDVIGESLGDWLESHDITLDERNVYNLGGGCVESLLFPIACPKSYYGTSSTLWDGKTVPSWQYTELVLWHLLFGCSTDEKFPEYVADSEFVRRTLSSFVFFQAEDYFAAEGDEFLQEELSSFESFLEQFSPLLRNIRVPTEAEVVSHLNRTSQRSLFRWFEADVWRYQELHEAVLENYREAAPLDSLMETIDTISIFEDDVQRSVFAFALYATLGHWECPIVNYYVPVLKAIYVGFEDWNVEGVLEDAVYTLSCIYGSMYEKTTYFTWLRSVGLERNIVYEVEKLHEEVRYMRECDASPQEFLNFLNHVGEVEHHNGFILEWGHVEGVLHFYMHDLETVQDVEGANPSLLRVFWALLPNEETCNFVEYVRSGGVASLFLGFKEWFASGKLLQEFLEEPPKRLLSLKRTLDKQVVRAFVEMMKELQRERG